MGFDGCGWVPIGRFGGEWVPMGKWDNFGLGCSSFGSVLMSFGLVFVVVG